MELKVRLGSVTKILKSFKTIEQFEKSAYHKRGWRLVKQPSESVKQIIKENTAVSKTASESKEDTNAVAIESLQEEYEKVTGKKVSNKYKNNSEWLTNKIDEAKEQ